MKSNLILKSILAIAFVFAVSICASAIAYAQGETYGSLTGGEILNPNPGEQIVDTQPMIGVKLPANLSDLNTATSTVKVYFFLDGNDVTSEAQISVEYIFYIPAAPLALGNHNILVKTKLKDIIAGTETTIPGAPDISWSFSVVSRAIKTQPQISVAAEKPSTTGRFSFNLAAINLNNAMRSAVGYADSDIKYRETLATTASLDFTHRQYGNTTIGHYDRSIEEITGRANDYFYFRFLFPGNDITTGDFPVTLGEFSEYSMTGFRMRGVKSIYELNPKYRLTSFAGRSQEPQSGRYKRMTYGIKIDTKLSKNDTLRVIALNSKESGISTTSTVPLHDNIGSVINNYKINNRWKTFSEFAFSNHTERGLVTSTALNRDFAYKNSLGYKSKRVEALAGRRTVGPSFNPTVLGSFVEADREGNFATLNYTPSTRFMLRNSFDVYHNNVRHTATYDYTDKSTNAISSLVLTYPHLPILDARYSKLYTKTDANLAIRPPGASINESTNANFRLSKRFNDLYAFNGTNLAWTFTRYDIDRQSFTTAVNLDFNLRSDSRAWSFSTRFKDLALFSYNTNINKSFIYSQSTTNSQIDTRTNTDAYSLQLNIIPFKFLTNFSYRRLAQSTYNTYPVAGVNTTSLAAAPRERQHVVSFIYYLSQKKKLNLDLENYDKEFRAKIVNPNRDYTENVVRLGYSAEF